MAVHYIAFLESIRRLADVTQYPFECEKDSLVDKLSLLELLSLDCLFANARLESASA